MKISYNWIKDYLRIDFEPEKVAEILTDIGLEIEATEKWCSVKGGLEGVVIGEVLTCIKHPDADRLSVTTVNTGDKEPLHIVCGAPNVAAGQKVPVACIGAILYKDDESFEIKKTKIRGELSEGMICAEDELGLGNSHDGIMVLDNNAKPGTPASKYFNLVNDFIFEIGLTPNRIDSGSHFGVARDLSAYLKLNENRNIDAVLPSIEIFKPDDLSNEHEVIVENSEDCPRYTGVKISGVTIGESPEWLKNKLKAVGLNPINNVVDITNFVQHEIGQPLHSFDADMIAGNKVIIKNLPDKTKFVTLDETERTLSSKDLMICNQNEGMCIAGVFGGVKSGVTQSTKNIFLESAYFNPVSIRKTSKRHGLQTDASYRFERGVDPGNTLWALKRAALLIKDIAGGKITSDIIDVYPQKIENTVINVSYKRINRLIGKEIDKEVIKRIFNLLDIIIKHESGDEVTLEIPSYRIDVKKEADVVEEILRMYGYNNVEISNNVKSTISYEEKPDKHKVVNMISDLLSSNGFSEIMCNSLNPSSWYDTAEEAEKKQLVTLANPLSSDLNVMRQTLLYGGLNSIVRNINRQTPDLKFYEFGQCYIHVNHGNNISKVEDFSEKISLDLFITGDTGQRAWNYKENPTDFFNIKSYVEMILSRLGIVPEKLSNGESEKRYFSDSLTYKHDDKIIAELGCIAKRVLDKFDIEQDVYYAHVEWDIIMEIISNNSISFNELPKYPSVRRDLALLIDKGIRFGQIKELAYKTEKDIIKDVNLFDVYESDDLGKGKKSYAVSFLLRDDNRTMTDKNIDRVMNNLVKVFEKELDAKVR